MCVCPTPVGDSEDDELVVEPIHLKNMLVKLDHFQNK